MTPSEGSAMDLAKFAAIPRNKITVIPNPVDFQILKQLASEPPKHKWFNPGEPPVVVGLGELGGSKDYETLIKAFSKVRHKRFLRLFIMGRGKNKRNLEKLSSDLGVTKDIEFFGFVKNPFPYLSRASLFVHSSRYEGFGMALLEALALGVPVVATDCPFGPRDILQNGLYGALVPIGDSETMAKHMALILDTPPAPSFLVQAAQPYSLENVTEQYMQTLGLSQIA